MVKKKCPIAYWMKYNILVIAHNNQINYYEY
jgi:hypothetical protein